MFNCSNVFSTGDIQPLLCSLFLQKTCKSYRLRTWEKRFGSIYRWFQPSLALEQNGCNHLRKHTIPLWTGKWLWKIRSWLQHFFQHLPQPEAAKCNMNITDKLVPSLKMNTSSQYAAASLEKTGSFWDLGIPSLKNALLKNTSGYFKYTLLEVHVWYKASYGWKVYFIVSTTSLENSTISSPSYKDIDCISSLAPFQNSSQFLWCLSCFIFLV